MFRLYELILPYHQCELCTARRAITSTVYYRRKTTILVDDESLNDSIFYSQGMTGVIISAASTAPVLQ